MGDADESPRSVGGGRPGDQADGDRTDDDRTDDDRTDDGTQSTGNRGSVGTGRLLSRVLVTWVELTVVGFTGAAVGGLTSGPPQLVGYFATVLGLVAVFMYNVDQHVTERLADVR